MKEKILWKEQVWSLFSSSDLSALELEFGGMASAVAEAVRVLFVNKFKSYDWEMSHSQSYSSSLETAEQVFYQEIQHTFTGLLRFWYSLNNFFDLRETVLENGKNQEIRPIMAIHAVSPVQGQSWQVLGELSVF